MVVDSAAAAETGPAVEVAWVQCLGPVAAVVWEPGSLMQEWSVEHSIMQAYVSYAG